MQINFYASLRKISGQKTIELQMPVGCTVTGLLNAVIDEYPAMEGKLLDEHGNLGLHAHVIVNGRDAPLLKNALNTELLESDKIDIFPIGHF